MESLYQYLREEHGIYIESGRDTLEAALPSEEVQKALKIDAQMPILSGHGRHSGRAARFLNIRSAIIREIVISTRWNCKHMTCKKTKPDRSAKSARCESVETKMIGLIGAGNTPMDGRKIKKRKRIQMNLKKKYGNYELHPQMKITGYENEIWDEKKEIIEELKRAVQEKQKEKKTCILSFDLYPGVRKEEMMELANALQPDRIFDIEDCAKDEETLLREFKDYITDDRVFGIMCHKTIDTWFESEKLETVKKAIETERAEEKDTNGGLIVIVGTAAELLTEADLLVYCDLTRWEVQLRYRSGMPNWHSTNYNDPILTKYKRGFFIEWRLADRYKKERYEKFTYLLDTEKENAPVLTTGNAFRGALQQLARQPFRMEPYFDPGVWGGQWMKENFGLDASKENFAWSFDGVPEENSLNLEIGGKVLKVPAQDLVFYAPHELLGERVHGRFGAEFPIRFDLLDTMGGQNLSLQVHPLTEYIYENSACHIRRMRATIFWMPMKMRKRMYTSVSKKVWIKKRWGGNFVQQKKEKNFSLRKNMSTKFRSKNTIMC